MYKKIEIKGWQVKVEGITYTVRLKEDTLQINQSIIFMILQGEVT